MGALTVKSISPLEFGWTKNSSADGDVDFEAVKREYPDFFGPDKATSKSDVADGAVCEKCACELNGEAAHIDAVDEIWCHSCADNAAEAAYERHCEAYHDGGSTQFRSLLDQQIEAQKLK